MKSLVTDQLNVRGWRYPCIKYHIWQNFSIKAAIGFWIVVLTSVLFDWSSDRILTRDVHLIFRRFLDRRTCMHRMMMTDLCPLASSLANGFYSLTHIHPWPIWIPFQRFHTAPPARKWQLWPLKCQFTDQSITILCTCHSIFVCLILNFIKFKIADKDAYILQIDTL